MNHKISAFALVLMITYELLNFYNYFQIQFPIELIGFIKIQAHWFWAIYLILELLLAISILFSSSTNVKTIIKNEIKMPKKEEKNETED